MFLINGNEEGAYQFIYNTVGYKNITFVYQAHNQGFSLRISNAESGSTGK